MTTRMLSYVHGTGLEPLRGQTVGQCFDRAVERFGDNEALAVPHQGIRLSYQDLGRRIDALAAGLVSLGLEPGERIGIVAPNCVEWVLTQFASAKAGLILVNINPAYRKDELAYALNTVGCKALITTVRLKTSNYVEMIRELVPEVDGCRPGRLESQTIPSLTTLIVLGREAEAGMLSFDDVATRGTRAEHQRLEELADVLQFDDPINIQFTSGTTGSPKAATLTHHNIVNNAYFAGEKMALSSVDRLCIPVPMYHCFGMVLGTLCAVAHGATSIFPSESFDAGAVLATIESEGCTAVHGVPTMFIAELDHPDFAQRDMSTLRTGIMAGAPCPEELMKRVVEEMHAQQITIAYGMTETGPVSFQTSVDDPLDRRVTTVGRVLPHTEIKIVDSEGRIVPRGEPGELLTRGYLVMREYWNDPERTAAAIDAGGWIASGDRAVIDEEGYCKIVGRIKDMLIRGGENIFPREIEEFLYTCPKIEEVEVFGVPDEKYGEEVCAWIKLRHGASASEDDIRAFCEGHISHFKIPRYIRFVDEFPMTVTGKVKKYVMREIMTEELGLEQ